jgi:hypothetical protein
MPCGNVQKPGRASVRESRDDRRFRAGSASRRIGSDGEKAPIVQDFDHYFDEKLSMIP